MYTSVCILVLGLAIGHVQGDPTDEMKKCFHVFHPGSMKCCKSIEKKIPTQEIMECLPNGKGPHTGPPTCDVEICIAKKMGYLGTDAGTVNKAALKQKIETDMPDKAATLVKECVEGDISKYGPADACELFKTKNCMQLHALLDCTEWDDQGPCPEVKSQLDECVKILA